ncbi:MAG TPA: hypothetical protein VGJ19_16805, partial [Streptosporangiaceae bacterium]
APVAGEAAVANGAVVADGAAGVGAATGVDGGPAPGGEPPGRRPRRTLAIAAALLLIAVAGALIGASVGRSELASAPAAGSPASSPAPVGPAEVRQTSRSVSVPETGVGTVDFDGVGGRLTVATAPGPIRLTGTLNWTGQRPRTSVTRDRTGQVLRLAYRCAPVSPCTEDYRLTVPAGTALTVRQPSGQLTLAGLSGRLAITAASADVVAQHLKAADLRAAITGGRFDASFDDPPHSVQIELTRADGTVRVPGTVRYRVTQQTGSGSLDVRVPRSGSAARTISAVVRDSQLALLPS